MFYIGGVLTGSGRVSYTLSDMDLPWVIRHTRQAWRAARAGDRDATWFVAPLAEAEEPVAVLDPEEIRAGLGGGCPGC
jgi:hypothetical protein